MPQVDFEVARYCNRLGAGRIDSASELVCDVGFLMALWVVLLALAVRLDPTRRRALLVAFGVAAVAHFLINEATLKHLLLQFRPIRLRPYLAHPGDIASVGHRFQDSSFPSSHAASTAAFATILGYHYRWSIPLGLAFVLFMDFCRVHNGMHYPSDVSIGSLLGVCYGAAGVYGAAVHLRRRAELEAAFRGRQSLASPASRASLHRGCRRRLLAGSPGPGSEPRNGSAPRASHRPTMRSSLPLALAFAALAACQDDTPSAAPAPSPGASAGQTGQPSGGSAGAPSAPSPVGRCSYKNPFSKGDECKEYTGPGWTAQSAAADCQEEITGAPGVFSAGQGCSFAASLGRCLVGAGSPEESVVHSEGSDASRCQPASGGCKLFAKGSFEPGNTCSGGYQQGGNSGGNAPGKGYGSTPFVQPYRVCKPPLPGEPPGKGEGGQVCTWTLISGCTEEGRRFDDYASCDDVLTQRPYYPAPPRKTTDPADPRLADQGYMAEVEWARKQAEASACVCCHTRRTAPEGPSQWLTDGEGIWLDTVSDSGLAMMAGLADSTALGAFAAEQNNGFDRSQVGLPTTDVPRMKALLLAEWARRGFSPEEGAKYAPFGGPLVDQLNFTPGPCAEGEGVAADGSISWVGGAARYLYVLAEGASSPGVPPNLDAPEGTLWLVDVPSGAGPFESGSARYGEPSGALRQRLPAAGPAPALAPGQRYHLHVLRDIGFPLTRCLFTAQGG